METFLNCDMRNEVGTNACHRIRAKGHVPGVIYGHHFSNYPLEIDKKEIERIIRNNGDNALVSVNINGIDYPAMIKDIQRDPVHGQIVHIDLQQVYATEKIHASVPVLLVGKEGLSRETIIQQQLQKLDIECFPTNVPKFVSVDLSMVPMGGNLKIGDVEFGEELSILNDANEIILSLSEAKAEMAEEEPSIEDIKFEVPLVKSVESKKETE